MNTSTEAFWGLKLYQGRFLHDFSRTQCSHFFLGWIWRVKRNCSPKSPLPRSHLFLLSLASFFVCVLHGLLIYCFSIFPTIQFHPHPHPLIPCRCFNYHKCFPFEKRIFHLGPLLFFTFGIFFYRKWWKMNKLVCIIRFISNYLFSKIHILMVKPHHLQIKTHDIGKTEVWWNQQV